MNTMQAKSDFENLGSLYPEKLNIKNVLIHNLLNIYIDNPSSTKYLSKVIVLTNL